VSTVLTLLDGLHHPLPSTEGKDKKAVLVIATTSKPDAIDPALRRPGRYNRQMLTSSPHATSKVSSLFYLSNFMPTVFSVLMPSNTWANLV
jgi:SpoVK/Ycf46/Vps4 family AAA+-type ATPase